MIMLNEWKSRSVYQIYPKSFCDSDGDGIGDLKGIISKLDYLKDLEIGAIWLTPIYKSPQIDNGYDISDYYDVDKMFGSKDDLVMLIKEAHNRDIKIMMDIVINHTSSEHKWFREALEDSASKYRDYYIIRPGKDGKEPNNWQSFFGGSAWEKIPGEENYYLHLFAKEQPDLNWENKNLRIELEKMMNYWIGLGVDSFRLDVINLISKENNLPDDFEPIDGKNGKRYYIKGPHLLEYLTELKNEVFKDKILTVGETMASSIEDGQQFTNSETGALDMVFSMQHLEVDFKNGDRWSVQDVNFKQLKEILSNWQEKLEDVGGWNSLFWSNHDQPRVVSRFGNDTEEEKRILSAKMLATALHFLKGTPFIYQGEEFGMTNPCYTVIEEYQDIETLNIYSERDAEHNPEVMKGIIRQSRDNARSPMQWDDTINAGFTTGNPWMLMGKNYIKVNALRDKENRNGIFAYYKKINHLRKNELVIQDGKYDNLDVKNDNVWVYTRNYEDNTLLVMVNFTDSNQYITLSQKNIRSILDAKKILSNYDDDKKITSCLRPYEAVVYKY